jgi:hypothetical protein
MSKHPSHSVLHAYTPHPYSAHNLLHMHSCNNECTDSHGSGVADESTEYSETSLKVHRLHFRPFWCRDHPYPHTNDHAWSVPDLL